jgi:hypothetical protein
MTAFSRNDFRFTKYTLSCLLSRKAVSLAAIRRGGYGRREGGYRKKRRLDARGRVLRRGRIFARLREGYAYDEVAREEELTPERVLEIVREALARRIVRDRSRQAAMAPPRVDDADRHGGRRWRRRSFLKVLDRLDRTQRAAKVKSMTTRSARDCSTRSTAANLGLDTAADAAPASKDSQVAAGKEEEKEKCRWGSAQAFEKARSGEGNPRISLAQIWLGFAGFVSDLAQFGFSLDDGRTLLNKYDKY